jgi:peptide-methionine (S)-S-oxide reductase
MAVATFGAGCFWGVELTFQKTKGVLSTSVGYTGGTTKNPTYEDVCTGRSGHAEVVRMEFDPSIVSYDELLDVLWGCHDPTTLNRQGPDRGTQYRSAIYFHSPDQEDSAKASKQKTDGSGQFSSSIVTEITPAPEYYIAEDYHQKYLEKRGMGSCH